ncbi:MAG: hypothetical protein HY587_01240 [Candidatus Omnitrophica bacterium]|nr:hypothetical protein [Candidatus Omnitrophota bacterium]
MSASSDLFTGLPFQTIRVEKKLFMPAKPEMTVGRLKWLRKRVHRVKLTTLAKQSGISFLESYTTPERGGLTVVSRLKDGLH